MKRFLALHFIPLLAVFVSSCGISTGVVSFETLEPATITLPGDTRNPVFINRAPLSPNSLITPTNEMLEMDDMIILDTMIINHLKKGINTILDQQTMDFENEPVWIDMRRQDSSAFRQPLDMSFASGIFENYHSDILFSLENYAFKSKVKIEDPIESAYYYGEVSLSASFTWFAYLPEMDQPFDTCTLSDTLYWWNWGLTAYEALKGENMPAPTDMFREASYLGGENYGWHILPHWMPAERMIYQGNEEEFVTAANLTNHGQWEDAVAIWQNLLNHEKKSVRGKAAYNLAVWYEMNDDLDQALAFAIQAAENIRSDRFEMYIGLLRKRINNKNILKQQLSP
ncbi:MAG: DUF6340 family protein [Bacteroidota bacterium]